MWRVGEIRENGITTVTAQPKFLEVSILDELTQYETGSLSIPFGGFHLMARLQNANLIDWRITLATTFTPEVITQLFHEASQLLYAAAINTLPKLTITQDGITWFYNPDDDEEPSSTLQLLQNERPLGDKLVHVAFDHANVWYETLEIEGRDVQPIFMTLVSAVRIPANTIPSIESLVRQIIYEGGTSPEIEHKLELYAPTLKLESSHPM